MGLYKVSRHSDTKLIIVIYFWENKELLKSIGVLSKLVRLLRLLFPFIYYFFLSQLLFINF